jgi:hypothetical protein
MRSASAAAQTPKVHAHTAAHVRATIAERAPRTNGAIGSGDAVVSDGGAPTPRPAAAGSADGGASAVLAMSSRRRPSVRTVTMCAE